MTNFLSDFYHTKIRSISLKSSKPIEKVDSVLVHKTVRLERSFVEDIEEESKRKNQDFSKTLRKRFHNSEYFSPKDKQLLGKVFNDYHIEGPTFKDKLMTFANVALNHNGVENNDTQNEFPTKQENPFDYEKWYCDCEFGTYFKEKKKVHCRCSYPSISKWLPKDRLVDPQVCDRCSETQIPKIQEFIEKRREEKDAFAHTKPYFTNEYGQKISY